MPRKQPFLELMLLTVLTISAAETEQWHQPNSNWRSTADRSRSSSMIKPAVSELKDVYNSNRVRRLHNFGSQHGHLANSRSRALVSLLLDTAQHEYIKGAATLAKSAMLYAPDYFNARVLLVVNGRNYSDQVLRQAQVVGWTLKWVDPIKPPHLASTSESKDMFARLHLWNMVEYSQVVYMDLDVAFVAPLTGQFISRLAYPTKCKLWAARDLKTGVWQKSFSMGVVGLIPNATEYARLLDLLLGGQVEYDYAKVDQGYLNTIYNEANGEWCEMDFELNADLAAYSQVRSYWESTTPEVVHYSVSKPWACATEYKAICDLWEQHVHSNVHPVTVVSAYYAGPSKHSDADYQEWGRYFLAHKMPLILFTDHPETIPGLSERDQSITKVIKVNASAFLMSHKMFDWDKQLSLDPEKSIHSTHIFKVWLEKTNFVQTAIGIDPFKSQHFVWVDFGCVRSKHWADTWVALSARFPAHEQQMLLLKSPGSEVTSPKQIGGTIFGGSKVAWKYWSMAFYNIVRRKYRQGEFIGDDQIPMTTLVVQHPKLVCVLQPQSVNGSDPWFFLLWYLAGKAPEQVCSTSIPV